MAREQEAPVTSCVLAAGYAHSLLLGRSSLTSWGGAGSGCLGQGSPNTTSAPPGQVGLFQAVPGLRVAQVAAGKQHSLALTEAGVYAWGDNRFGQLGVGKPASRSCTERLVPGWRGWWGWSPASSTAWPGTRRAGCWPGAGACMASWARAASRT